MNNGQNTQGTNVAGTPAPQQAPVSNEQGTIIQQLIEQNKMLMEELRELRKMRTTSGAQIQGATDQSQAKPKAARNTTGTPMICTETGLIYKSKAKAGKAVAPEFGYTEENPPKNKDGGSAWNFIIYYILQAPGGKYRLIPYTGNKNPGEKDEDFVMSWLEKNQTDYLKSIEDTNRDPSPLLLLEDEYDDDEAEEEVEEKEKTAPTAQQPTPTASQQNPAKPPQQAPVQPQNRQGSNQQQSNKDKNKR